MIDKEKVANTLKGKPLCTGAIKKPRNCAIRTLIIAQKGTEDRVWSTAENMWDYHTEYLKPYGIINYEQVERLVYANDNTPENAETPETSEVILERVLNEIDLLNEEEAEANKTEIAP